MLVTREIILMVLLHQKTGSKCPTIVWVDSEFQATCEGQCGSGPNVAILPEGRVLSGIATPRQAIKFLVDSFGILVDERYVAAIQVSLTSTYFDRNFEFGIA